METMSLSPPSTPADQQEASGLSDLSTGESLLFSDSLKDLKNMRSLLYSAAEYFELSYISDNQKQIVMNTLKDYTVQALFNTVDHLGSVSYKVKGLVSEEVDEVSVAEFRVSCIEQRLRTCQECIDKEGQSQQSLIIKAPKYHKHYMLQCDTSPQSNTQPMSKLHIDDPHKEINKSKQIQTETCATSKGQPSAIRSVSMCPSPSQKTHSLSPVRKAYSPPTSPQHRMVSPREGRTTSPFRSSTPNARARSTTSRPTIFNSSKQYVTDSKDSAQLPIPDERNNQKETHQNPTKSKGFLKTLLTRQKSRTDELLYRYLDEY